MFLHKTQDGYLVYDRHKSHIHIEAIPFLEEALGKICARGEKFLVEQVVFPHVIGFSKCVPTDAYDEIIYAQRHNRHGLTRFVKNREPIEATSMVIILKQISKKSYVLISAYVGEIGLVEPWDWTAHCQTSDPLKSYYASVESWKRRALIWDETLVIQGTATQHPW